MAVSPRPSTHFLIAVVDARGVFLTAPRLVWADAARLAMYQRLHYIVLADPTEEAAALAWTLAQPPPKR